MITNCGSSKEYVRIYPGVEMGEGAEIGEHVVVGVPAAGDAPGEVRTVIGDRAVLRSHTVIYAGNRIGDDFTTGHGALIREQNQIGRWVSVGSHSVVEHHVEIGDGVRIHTGAFVPEHTVLAGGAWIGPHAVLTNARYPQSSGVKERLRGPEVGAGAVVGANATILPGVQVGARAVVGAGSVVVSDVPDGHVVAGNPARTIKTVDEIEEYEA